MRGRRKSRSRLEDMTATGGSLSDWHKLLTRRSERERCRETEGGYSMTKPQRHPGRNLAIYRVITCVCMLISPLKSISCLSFIGRMCAGQACLQRKYEWACVRVRGELCWSTVADLWAPPTWRLGVTCWLCYTPQPTHTQSHRKWWHTLNTSLLVPGHVCWAPSNR